MPKRKPGFVAGERLIKAFALAVELHANQARKQEGVPYISHLMDVSGLVMQYGGSEDQAIAALLHDGPEDQGGRATLKRIRIEFGECVARIVEDCTDSFADEPSPPWQERKQQHIDHFRRAPEQGGAAQEACLVYAADKLSNARTMVDFQRRQGASAWKHFESRPAQMIWYLQSMAAAFRSRGVDAEMLDQLDREVEALKQLIAATPSVN